MDTTPLEEKIKAIEAEIADKEHRAYLLKVGIKADKKALNGYKEALEEVNSLKSKQLQE